MDGFSSYTRSGLELGSGSGLGLGLGLTPTLTLTLTRYDIRSLLIGPVLDAEGKVIGLVELVNKDPERNEGSSFSKDDEKLLAMLCSHCSIFIESLEV